MKPLTITQSRNSFWWSAGLHTMVLLLAFLPLTLPVVRKAPAALLLEIGFFEPSVTTVSASGSEGRQAQSPVYNETPEAGADLQAEEPLPVDASDPDPTPELADAETVVSSEVTGTEVTEIIAGDPDAGGSSENTTGEGGGAGSPFEGDQAGSGWTGDGAGGEGLGGDGILTRKVIRRPDISQAARVNGRVTMDICIDRAGKVTQVAYDPEKTTITDNSVILQSSHLALGYRFEPRYTAPLRECGELTFVFRIEADALAAN